MYEVLLESSAERDLNRLRTNDFDRVMPHVIRLAENPRPVGCRKIVGSAKNDWRIRVGDFRVIYEIDDKDEKVRIMHVRHRREAYR